MALGNVLSIVRGSLIQGILRILVKAYYDDIVRLTVFYFLVMNFTSDMDEERPIRSPKKIQGKDRHPQVDDTKERIL